MPQSPRELHHVGVELETPGNIWSVPTPPADWLIHLITDFEKRRNGFGDGPARSSVLWKCRSRSAPNFEEEQQQSESNGEAKLAEAAIPSPEAGPSRAGWC